MAADESVTLGLIVEGHGEGQAVRRIRKSPLVQPKELERSVEALTRQIIGRKKRLD